MKTMKFLPFVVIAVILTSCGGSANKSSIAGAGATFPLPFYNIAFKNYQDSLGVNISYGGVGSGGGIRSLKDKIVDFAGSDAYLSEKEIAEMPGEVLHIPSCLGAIVLAYNLPEVQNLNLSGEIVADIYMGNITNWNDSRIVELNNGVNLPDLKINPVYRSDGSGTTFVFSDYLTKVSSQWAKTMGTAKALKWNVGIAAKGNPGVAGTVKESVGSIGYVGSEYSFSLSLPTTNLRNSAGNFVKPSIETISAAATSEMPSDMRVMITNSPSENAYPIACFTWLLIYKEQSYDKRTEAQARITVDLLKWMMSNNAQSITEKVHYAPLPQSVVENSLKMLNSITYNNQALAGK